MSDARESIGADELYEALHEYAEKGNASRRARTTLAGWNCRMHIAATDVPDARFTLVVTNGTSARPTRGLEDAPDLAVSGHSMDLAEMFWGDANPVSSYMQGAIRTQGPPDHVMRLDAMAMFIFLNQ